MCQNIKCVKSVSTLLALFTSAQLIHNSSDQLARISSVNELIDLRHRFTLDVASVEACESLWWSPLYSNYTLGALTPLELNPTNKVAPAVGSRLIGACAERYDSTR